MMSLLLGAAKEQECAQKLTHVHTHVYTHAYTHVHILLLPCKPNTNHNGETRLIAKPLPMASVAL